MELVKEIQELKEKRNALILAHLYQWPEVQDVADFVGDSLELSRKAVATDADVIVFCGVWFMAETTKILNPSKTVLLPEPNAGCPMADMVTAADVLALRAKYPAAAVVCYVNSSAEVKAASDICCTSSNAIKVVKSLKAEQIIFVPDRNLGHYISRFVPEKQFILYEGYCPTHEKISLEDVKKARLAQPGAPILAHPECRPEVIDAVDFVGSTKQIIDYAVNSKAEELIIGTEIGVLHRLQLLCPEKRFYSLHSAIVCPNMKKNKLSTVRDSLLHLEYQMELDEEVRKKAAVSVERMLAIR